MVLVRWIKDDLPNSPNFLPAKLSHYTVYVYIIVQITYQQESFEVTDQQ